MNILFYLQIFFKIVIFFSKKEFLCLTKTVKIMSVFCSSQSFLMMLKIVTTNLRTKTLSYQCILLVILGKHLVNWRHKKASSELQCLSVWCTGLLVYDYEEAAARQGSKLWGAALTSTPKGESRLQEGEPSPMEGDTQPTKAPSITVDGRAAMARGAVGRGRVAVDGRPIPTVGGPVAASWGQWLSANVRLSGLLGLPPVIHDVRSWSNSSR